MPEPKNKDELNYPDVKWFTSLGKEHHLLGGRVKSEALATIEGLQQQLGAAGAAAQAQTKVAATDVGSGAGGMFGELPAAQSLIMPTLQESLGNLHTDVTGLKAELDKLADNVPAVGKDFDGTERNNQAEVNKARAALDEVDTKGVGPQ